MSALSIVFSIVLIHELPTPKDCYEILSENLNELKHLKSKNPDFSDPAHFDQIQQTINGLLRIAPSDMAEFYPWKIEGTIQQAYEQSPVHLERLNRYLRQFLQFQLEGSLDLFQQALDFPGSHKLFVLNNSNFKKQFRYWMSVKFIQQRRKHQSTSTLPQRLILDSNIFLLHQKQSTTADLWAALLKFFHYQPTIEFSTFVSTEVGTPRNQFLGSYLNMQWPDGFSRYDAELSLVFSQLSNFFQLSLHPRKQKRDPDSFILAEAFLMARDRPDSFPKYYFVTADRRLFYGLSPASPNGLLDVEYQNVRMIIQRLGSWQENGFQFEGLLIRLQKPIHSRLVLITFSK